MRLLPHPPPARDRRRRFASDAAKATRPRRRRRHHRESIAYHLAVNHGIGRRSSTRWVPAPPPPAKPPGSWRWTGATAALSPPSRARRFAMHERLAKDLDIESHTAGSRARRSRWTRTRRAAGNGATAERRKLENVQWADVGAVASRAMGDEPPSRKSIPRVSSTRTSTPRGRAVSEPTSLSATSPPSPKATPRPDPKKCVGLVVDGDVDPRGRRRRRHGPVDESRVERLREPRRRVRGQKYHAVRMRPERVLSQAVFFQGPRRPGVLSARGRGRVRVRVSRPARRRFRGTGRGGGSTGRRPTAGGRREKSLGRRPRRRRR